MAGAFSQAVSAFMLGVPSLVVDSTQPCCPELMAKLQSVPRARPSRNSLRQVAQDNFLASAAAPSPIREDE